jgi:hypothetical protein
VREITGSQLISGLGKDENKDNPALSCTKTYHKQGYMKQGCDATEEENSLLSPVSFPHPLPEKSIFQLIGGTNGIQTNNCHDLT